MDRFSGSHDQPSQPCGCGEEGVACLHEVYHYALCTEIMLCMYLPISLRTVHRDYAVHVFANITTHCAQRLCCACICQYHYALCTEIMLCMYLPISLRTVHRDYAVHVFANITTHCAQRLCCACFAKITTHCAQRLCCACICHQCPEGTNRGLFMPAASAMDGHGR